MQKVRCDRRREHLRAYWPLDAPVPRPKPAEMVVGRVAGYPLLVTMWHPARKPPRSDVVWHPFGAWISFRLLDT